MARSIIAFEQVSLDGYFVDRHGDMSWAKPGNDAESQAFAASNASGDGIFAFGRVTYEMMAAFWPTPQAHAMAPVVAEHMNRRRKIVFSKHLDDAQWNNSTIVREDPVAYLRKMKEQAGPDVVILGSGSIVAQLASHGVIDEYQFLFCPIALGAGRTLFDGLTQQARLKLNSSRVFQNGKIFATYVPVRDEGSPA